MKKIRNARLMFGARSLMLGAFLLAPGRLCAADTLNWRTNQNLVTADIKSEDLLTLLEQVSSITGWRIYLEPHTTHTVSAKFKDLPPNEALRLLLGDLNFALLPETNASPNPEGFRGRLFVFRTSMRKATQLVRALQPGPSGAPAKLIPNELIVRLKPGAKIEDLARLLGAKVVGRIDSLNAYRLRFDDEAATSSARDELASNPDVSSVDNNYSMDSPPAPRELSSSSVPPPRLQLKPPPDTGRIIVGLVDTAVQPLGNDLDKFLLKQLAVAGDAQLDPSSPSHGTAMAETLLRSLQSLTKGSTSVQILPVDVYGPNSSTSTFDVAQGIAAAVNAGAKVINLSLGSDGDSSFLHNVIQEATGQNIVFFGAAGNTPVTTPFYPAAYKEVNAVTALDQGQLAPYANRGSFVSLGLPGTSVIYFNNGAYVVMGTSAAAAFASGAFAGFMDSTGSSASKAQSFMQQNFGVKIGSAK